MRPGLPGRSHIVSGLGNLNILILLLNSGADDQISARMLATPAQTIKYTTGTGRIQGKTTIGAARNKLKLPGADGRSQGHPIATWLDHPC
jgi:hypothetical protein